MFNSFLALADVLLSSPLLNYEKIRQFFNVLSVFDINQQQQENFRRREWSDPVLRLLIVSELAWRRYSNIRFQIAYLCGLFRQIQIHHSSHIGEQVLCCSHRGYFQPNLVLRILCSKKHYERSNNDDDNKGSNYFEWSVFAIISPMILKRNPALHAVR